MADIEVEKPAAATGGFSDAISRILSHTGVPRPKRIKREKAEEPEEKPIISDLSTTQPGNPDGNDGDVVEIKPTIKKSTLRGRHLSKQERDPWHVLPDVTERERERKLTKIATKGVVQLFNAVRAQQSSLEEKLEEAGPSFRKSEQALKSVSKGDFLDLLKNPSGSVKIRRAATASDDYGEAEEPKRWEVLDDEYMTRKRTGEDSSDEDDRDGNAGGYDAESDSGASLEEVF
ncbi:hypothetical protein BV898_02620 [Hypsibius exemplaris]|uniref:RRP15-like protein n=1 Tax=Hypsibius exemplaris TaxID=2072580 RepID=A0A1W0X897_HYPEX|nr:hypothetical protein BV898_02620 [Hypsibius exemplaris]